MEFSTLDKIFVLDKLNIVLNKKNLSRQMDEAFVSDLDGICCSLRKSLLLGLIVEVPTLQISHKKLTSPDLVVLVKHC